MFGTFKVEVKRRFSHDRELVRISTPKTELLR